MKLHGTRLSLLAGLMLAVGSANLFRPILADPLRSYQIIDLGTMGGSESTATGLNAEGQVVGVSDMPGDTTAHAFLCRDGKLHDLGTLGGSSSFATDVNS